jgi:hypothetical protein
MPTHPTTNPERVALGNTGEVPRINDDARNADNDDEYSSGNPAVIGPKPLRPVILRPDLSVS